MATVATSCRFLDTWASVEASLPVCIYLGIAAELAAAHQVASSRNLLFWAPQLYIELYVQRPAAAFPAARYVHLLFLILLLLNYSATV